MMSNFNKMLRENRGFTLVELIVVIAVLGILAGIAVPRITGVRQSADEASVKSDLRNIQSAIEVYYAEEDELPDTDDNDFVDIEDNLGNIDTDNYEWDMSNGSEEGEYKVIYTGDDADDIDIHLTEEGIQD